VELNDYRLDDEEQRVSASCMKIMLEAGADMSLEYNNWDEWKSTFIWDAVYGGSIVNTAIAKM